MAACVSFQLARYLPRPVVAHIHKSLASAHMMTAPYTMKAGPVNGNRFTRTSCVPNQIIPRLYPIHRRKASLPSTPRSSVPTHLSIEQYHKLADKYIERLVETLENLQDEKEEVDCEYSAGVLNLDFPPAGKYVINKQPPNKQIWLSSPVSGPKRYDYIDGKWIYSRDGGSLTVLLEEELGIKIDEESEV